MGHFVGRSLSHPDRVGETLCGSFLRKVIETWRDWIQSAPSQAELRVERALTVCTSLLSVWVVTDSLEVRAHIAHCYRRLEEYRGYLLFCDAQENAVLLDLTDHQYLRFAGGSARELIVVGGLANAKAFVDCIATDVSA